MNDLKKDKIKFYVEPRLALFQFWGLRMSDPNQSQHAKSHQTFWLWAMCLTGVDYFSTLGYQPSIAYEAAGKLSPFATLVVVLVTLFGAFQSILMWQVNHSEAWALSGCLKNCCMVGWARP